MVPSPTLPLVPIAMDGGVGLRLMLGERPSPRGLLRAVLALAIAAISGCVGSQGFQFRGTTALSFLRTVEQSKDPNARYVAYDKLSASSCYDDDAQKTRAATVLAAKLKEGREPIATRAVICRTLGMLRKPEAREVILTATNDEDALVRAEACRALGRVGRPEDATILARVMTLDTSAECRVAAIESLGELKSPDRRIIEFLVSGMEHDEPVIRVSSLNALRSITGKDLGVDVIAWKKYVDAAKPASSASPDATTSIPAAAASTLPETAAEQPPEIP
jgi:HEAT repeats